MYARAYLTVHVHQVHLCLAVLNSLIRQQLTHMTAFFCPLCHRTADRVPSCQAENSPRLRGLKRVRLGARAVPPRPMSACTPVIFTRGLA